jgi:UDP-N-acetylmuramoyl-tripeptide--D-alanyl-D-alanine ligase
MILEIIYRYAILLLALHALNYWAYFLQLKEYRWDRFIGSFDTFHDVKKIALQTFNVRYWYRPKFTLRALMSLFAGVALFLSVFVLLPVRYELLGLIAAPIAGTLGVLIINPFFWFIRRTVIFRARNRMRKFDGTVIGITGSVGKTSTKELLAHVLETKFSVERTQGNDNSEIGVALAALRIPLDTQFFIVEMGAYRRGEIKAICDIVRPKIGIITAIGDQHLSLFGSLENLRKTKFELIDALPQDGLRLVSGEDFHLTEASHIEMSRENISFTYKGEKFTVPILGKSRVSNLLAVIKVGEYLGIPLRQIAHALESIAPDLLYPKLYLAKKGGTIIDDTHNSSHESFLSVIDYLSVWEGYIKIVVTPGMIELGSRAREDHLRVGQALASVDKVFVTNPNFFEELNTSKNAILVVDHYVLLQKLEEFLSPKTVILFEGRMPKNVLDALTEKT